MTVTHEAVCTVKDCPAPANPDWHRPERWCGHATMAGSHQHWPKKGSGAGRTESKVVAFICSDCHWAIDNGPWGNAVLALPHGRVFRIWDENNNTIFERQLDAAGGEVEPKPKESSETTQRDTPMPSLDLPASGGQFVLDDWVRGVEALTTANDNWVIGDHALIGEQWLGSEAYQYLDPLSLTIGEKRLTQCMWVSGNWDEATRVADMSWSHHRTVTALSTDERHYWFRRAREEGLSARGLARAIHPPPPRPKRYSLQDLGQLLADAESTRGGPLSAREFLEVVAE